ncbi:hypothetical protein KSP40_PGU013495 [Platanthera guangdongensis]|uniref:SAWADEE domain-containing protein n=1 Tax=Platanthera guangdongensis TaxID=2320717 RepID=A0ABR2N0U4_9ASPA
MLLQEGKDLIDPNFHQKLANEFNRPPGRAENKAIQVQQVQRWFLNRLKLHKVEAVTSPSSSKEMSSDGEEILPISALQRSDFPEENGEKISEVEMEFEARSCRDHAWYDVSTFLAHKVLSSGEVEVRVRFDGFGPDEDEWVNVRKAVRERSVPMESSECWKLKEGDLLLCFEYEKDEAANYFDAHVAGIERKMHDIRGCRCIFLMRYDHDQNEERVHLSRLCRRP